jgi:hypothetical protein
MVVARQAVVSPSSNNRRSYFAPAIAEVADARAPTAACSGPEAP